MFTIYRGSPLTRFQLHVEVPTSAIEYTVNISRYKTIEANGSTGVIPTASKSFSLYQELLQPLWVIYQKMVIYLQRLKEFSIQAKGLAGSYIWNDTRISISFYSFVPNESQITLRSNVLRHHFYLPKVIMLVQTGLEYSACQFYAFKPWNQPFKYSIAILDLYYYLR